MSKLKVELSKARNEMKCTGRSLLLTLILCSGGVGAQVEFMEQEFKPDNFLTPLPAPGLITACDATCVGEVSVEMGTPVIDDVANTVAVDIVLLSVSVYEGFTLTPYLGRFDFTIGVGGPGIELNAATCTFTDNELRPYRLVNPNLAATGSGPMAITLGSAGPGVSIPPTEEDGFYDLSKLPDTGLKLGEFKCPLTDRGGVHAFVFTANQVVGFNLQYQDPTDTGVKGASFIMRAANSFEYYPLNGMEPFIFAGEVTGGGTGASLVITNNLPGVDTVITAGFTAIDLEEPTAGCSVAPGDPVVDGNQVTVTFSESQADNDCTVTFTVTLPDGSSYSYDQVVGTSGTPAEQLARAQANFIRISLENYTDYLPEKVIRPDGGLVAPGNFAVAAVEARVAMAMTRDEVPAALTGQEVQDQLVDTGAATGSSADDQTGVGTTTTPLTSAYSFSGMVTDVESTQISFVIDLGDAPLTTTTRLVKQLRDGNWRGVDNSVGADGGWLREVSQSLRRLQHSLSPKW